ncbi:S9 family peptidase [Streptomyces durhamensis]|uniref:S9 family peptidase n=1 Tax=Streptomyces durhamensis TaxID=68194 RepID=UPI0012FF2140|nr:prolyl oligopeptidase family serine peptidase [Streptomyces durhamensis]
MREAAEKAQELGMQVREATYGTWSSPVSEEHAAHSVFRLGDIQVDGEDVWWTEARPEEGGRTALVRRRPDGTVGDVGPTTLSVRSSVYEYGGGGFLVEDGTAYVVSAGDHRLWRLERDGGRTPLTPGDPGVRYADFSLDRARDRLVCLAEVHGDGGEHPDHRLVAVSLEATADPEVLVGDREFLCSPRVSPDGGQLCWIQWSAPRMPWDGTELWLAELDEGGRPVGARKVAGGPAESVIQPQWGPDGLLYFVSDRSGFWNIHRLRSGSVEPVTSLEVDFGRPQWVLHLVNYAFLDATTIAAAGSDQGRWRVYVVDTPTATARELPLPYTEAGFVVRSRSGRIVLDAASPFASRSVVEVDPATGAFQVLGRAQAAASVPREFLSEPEQVAFEGSEGRTTFGFFYRPRNPGFRAPDGTLPPLLVRVHGGPTAASSPMLDYAVQYWTTRGIAVLDVNYGGSSGYGRAYRERLAGRWGETDALDCIAGAEHLVARGEVDANSLIIQGESAGGFTVLNALAFHDTFHVGICHYGIADLVAFDQGTHKFESHYCERLVGPYPQAKEVYRERSPLYSANLLRSPLIMFQGLNDPVVPAGQSRAMYEAVRENGVPCAFLAFEGEEHGFRVAENIHRCIRAELYFVGRVLGFTDAVPDAAVEIENMA